MNVELGYALAPPASPGISRSSLDELDERVEAAHDRIQAGVETGADGYTSLDLYERVDTERIQAVVDEFEPIETVLVIGMGGSALGARAMANALAPADDWYILDTLDPVYLEHIIDAVDLEDTLCHVVSKSGSTVETRAIFQVIRQAMADEGIDWTTRTIATTGETGPLGRTIEENGATRLEPPDGVPGRYSALSSMALPSAAALGIDVQGLLTGAERAHRSLTGSLLKSPAYAYGAVMAELSAHGVGQNAFVTYGERLGAFGHWFSQLWAESLGKDGLGQTPIPGRGVADHHSQLQRWRAGPRDLAVTTLTTGDRGGQAVELDDATPVTLGALQELERRAMTASLGDAGVPAVGIELDRLDAESIGELFVSLEAATILVAELWEIDAFDQPAVDWAKSAVRAELGLESGAHAQLNPPEPLSIDGQRRG